MLKKQGGKTMIYVKTVYGEKSARLPNISKYSNKENVGPIIRACLKWGIDIVSCEVIDANEAKHLITRGAAETEGE